MTHAQTKKQLASASDNWQMPAKIRRAFSEPIPGVARFCMTHAHARSDSMNVQMEQASAFN